MSTPEGILLVRAPDGRRWQVKAFGRVEFTGKRPMAKTVARTLAISSGQLCWWNQKDSGEFVKITRI